MFVQVESNLKPEQLSSRSTNAICLLREVRRIQFKPFKGTRLDVAYAKKTISKNCKESGVYCTTHSSI